MEDLCVARFISKVAEASDQRKTMDSENLCSTVKLCYMYLIHDGVLTAKEGNTYNEKVTPCFTVLL